MREILEEIKVLQSKVWGRVPNLRGASSISRDDGGRSYAARTVGGRRSGWWRHRRGG